MATAIRAGFRYFAAEEGKKQGGPLLEDVLLADNKLTDGGLREVAKATTLTRLHISSEPGITPRGAIEHLPKLKRLAFLTLGVHEKKRWMPNEEQELHRRMPRCEAAFAILSGEFRRIRYKIGSGNPFAVPEGEEKGQR